MYDAIFDTTSNWLNTSNVGIVYKYMILGPKAVSQVAKTILSPITHVRNFVSASAFALANGAVLPNLTDLQTLAPKFLGGKGVLGEAYDLTGKRILGTMNKVENEAYKRLRRLGIVDTQVQVGEERRLFKDVVGVGGDSLFATAELFGRLGFRLFLPLIHLDLAGQLQALLGEVDVTVGNGVVGFGVAADMDQFARLVGMSRSQLFRKIKVLTGNSPSVFIRTIRLNRGKKLLQRTTMNVTEVVYEVGFSTPTYFSDAFLEAFGVRPSELRQ